MNAKKACRALNLGLLFLLALHVSARYLGFVLFPRVRAADGSDTGVSQDYAQYYFAGTPRDSVDTVFVGSSHAFCSVDVNLLKRDYGVDGILLTSSGQNLMLSYYAVLEAIELQHPKTVVLETGFAAEEREAPTVLAKRYFFDCMPNWTRAKALGVRAVGDEPYLYYYPVTALHNAWPDIQRGDFRLPPRLPDGERYCYVFDVTGAVEPWTALPPEEKAPLPEASERWLREILTLCRENDMRLILYTAPCQADEHAQRIYNGLVDFAAAEGLPYRNFLQDMDEIGLDFSRDIQDEGHLNRSGQQKLTRYLAETLLK